VVSGAAVVLESGTPAGLGDIAIGATVSSGGALYVFSGGWTIGTTVDFGGSETVDGGVASGTGVAFGGLQLVYGGSAGGAVVGDGGRQFVYRGGVASGTVVDYAGSEFVSGGATYGTVLGFGAKEYVSGGTAYGTVIDAGGYEIIESGGSAGGVAVIDGGGMIVSSGGVAAGGVQFVAGADGLLSIADTADFIAVVSGLGDGDLIDLTGLSYGFGATATLSGDLLRVHAGAGTDTITLDPAGLTDASFEVSRDGGGGTLVSVTCFCEGTQIATPVGETAVETLHAGDLVRLADGRALPVRWIGVQTVARRFADPARVLPVRIAAGALGEGVPARDLLVSPGHGFLLDGVLVQAGALAGLPGIARESEVAETFRYYHVELDEHALLLAEGLPAESFLPGAEEAAFDNRAERPARELGGEMPYPRVKCARQVPRALRAKLAGRTAA
jgi:autotransporter passenger strand-loop-strand repeat protein